jgi:hypothetical protein
MIPRLLLTLFFLIDMTLGQIMIQQGRLYQSLEIEDKSSIVLRVNRTAASNIAGGGVMALIVDADDSLINGY